jgi:Xaa-Pro aminopeptidase
MALAVVPKQGKITLICSEFEAAAAKNTCSDINVETYPVWIYIADLADGNLEKDAQPDTNETFKMAIDIINSACSNPKKIGVESSFITFSKMNYLIDTYGMDKISNCEEILQNARSIKTPWEIEVLRTGAKAGERAMFETAINTEVGMNEEDILHIWNKACLNQGKDFYTQFAAHTLGEHYSPVVIPRKNVTIKEGDIVRLDGGPTHFGYTTDLARTYVVGNKVKPEREKIFEVLLKANDLAFELIGPGVKMSEVFKKTLNVIRKDIPDYIRGHFGHSIGCSRFTEEYPFISATEEKVFAPGMVFCLETPYYSSFNNSYNLEDEFVITENGIERFTNTNRSLFWEKL